MKKGVLINFEGRTKWELCQTVVEFANKHQLGPGEIINIAPYPGIKDFATVMYYSERELN
jgi:hypothetical protein